MWQDAQSDIDVTITISIFDTNDLLGHFSGGLYKISSCDALCNMNMLKLCQKAYFHDLRNLNT